MTAQQTTVQQTTGGFEAKRSAVLAGGTLRASGLLPRALPRTARPAAAAKAKPVQPAKAAAAPRAPAAHPSIARMAACMRFRSYIAS